jgi:hypothetical protein
VAIGDAVLAAANAALENVSRYDKVPSKFDGRILNSGMILYLYI